MKPDGNRQLEFVKEFDYIREAGTKGEQKAALRLEKEIRSLSLAPCTEEFSFTEWEVTEAVFSVTEPYEKEYAVRGILNCGSTPKEGICAPFVYVENGDDISLSFARDAIVLINEPVQKEMYEKLIRAGAKGFLCISGTPVDRGKDRIPRQFRLRFSGEKPLQGASIHHLDAIELVERGASQGILKIRQQEKERISRNILATIPGTDKKEEILTLTAHYDSVPEGPGAYDNMAACAMILEVLRCFCRKRPRRTIRCIWFGAEEKGLKGSQAYVQAHEKELSGHVFNINVDLAGQLAGGNVLGITGSEAAASAIASYLADTGIGFLVKRQVWSSDSNTFAWKGIPAMTLNRDGYGMHTRHDTVKLLSAWSMERSARLLYALAQWLAEEECMPFPKEIPPEMREELEKSFS